MFCLSSSWSWVKSDDRLNFVFFLVDDLGYMDVGFNNPGTFYETPNLDQLARSGMVFTDFYAAAPVCSPTRASILTGKYPATLNSTNYFTGKRSEQFVPPSYVNELPESETTLAEALKSNNYQTFFAGRWHLGNNGPAPLDHGSDENHGGGRNGSPRNYFAPYKNIFNLEPGPDGEHLTARLAEESIGFIDRLSGDDPFLLYLSFYSVHTPLQAPEELIQKYEAKAKLLPAGDDFKIGGERQVWPNTKDRRRVRIRQSNPTYAA
ncbi:MAG: sulfatase-like hydrolase/transferase, partial [Verrucomicrobiota bacterium]